MQKSSPLLLTPPLGPLRPLGECNNKPVVPHDDDPQAAQLKNAPPVAAPPMIMASRTYRCDDNSLVYADFYTNNTVSVRMKKEPGSGTILTAADGKPPYTAPGYSLSANSTHISYSAPGKKAQACDA